MIVSSWYLLKLYIDYYSSYIGAPLRYIIEESPWREERFVTLLLELGLSSDFYLVHFSIAFSRGILKGEAVTLSWTREGVTDLRLLGSGILGLFLCLGVCCAIFLLVFMVGALPCSIYLFYPSITVIIIDISLLSNKTS